jgi:Ni,Fe-hydrogenase I small subunit
MSQLGHFFGNGISRRDFIKTCVATTAVMGLPFSMAAKVAEGCPGTGSTAGDLAAFSGMYRLL